MNKEYFTKETGTLKKNQTEILKQKKLTNKRNKCIRKYWKQGRPYERENY